MSREEKAKATMEVLEEAVRRLISASTSGVVFNPFQIYKNIFG